MWVWQVCVFFKILMRNNEGGNEKQEIYWCGLSNTIASFVSDQGAKYGPKFQFNDIHDQISKLHFQGK